MAEGKQTRRMHGHDYAVPGTYEVTMVVTDRQLLNALRGLVEER